MGVAKHALAPKQTAITKGLGSAPIPIADTIQIVIVCLRSLVD
jgi:hypothetical protein